MINNPTLETHILSTEEATALIDWCTKPIQYPLPTEVVMYPGTINTQRFGSIWLSLSTDVEYVGVSSSLRNHYYIAQVYRDTSTDKHIDYNLYGWFHITHIDLTHLMSGKGHSYYDRLLPDEKELYKCLYIMYNSIEKGEPYRPLPILMRGLSILLISKK